MRRISLDAAGTALSALVCEPAEGPPRATVVAVHGAGMSAGYFDSQALPDFSLLTLGARLGYTVVALDRPGYGLSTDALPDGQPVAEQAATLAAAVRDFGARYPTGAGTFLLAHSFGGKVALLTAADHAPSDLLGVEISGCGHRYAPDAFTGTGASREAGAAGGRCASTRRAPSPPAAQSSPPSRPGNRRTSSAGPRSSGAPRAASACPYGSPSPSTSRGGAATGTRSPS